MNGGPDKSISGPIYPVPGFHFRVTFEGLEPTDIDTRFQEVSGLSAEISTEELAEGGENRFVHKLPVRARFPNLVLKRGLFNQSSNIVKWAQDAIANFEFKPCTVIIHLLNEKHEPLMTWNFQGAYPVKLDISNLNANENSFLVETLELAYKYMNSSSST
jgi:phage tail-like protein